MQSYLERLERDMAAGALHLLLLGLIGRLAPIHGYALIKALADRTGGALQIKPGTIYPILNDLERMGVVRSAWGGGGSGPQRKEYELTATGREILAHAARRWQVIDGAVRGEIGGGGSS